MKNEFRDFAVKHMGLNGLAVDDYMNITSSYISPTIIEERQLNVAQMGTTILLAAQKCGNPC